MQRFSLADLNINEILNCSLCCASVVNWAARSSIRIVELCREVEVATIGLVNSV